MTTLKYRKTRANAMTPRRSHSGDAGLDLAPTEFANIEPGRTVKLPTGIAVVVPAGCMGLVVPRSSAKLKGMEILGIVDQDFRGELHLAITNVSNGWITVEREAYCAQLIVVPVVVAGLELVTDFGADGETSRGENGWGSSGDGQ
jgi:dUTP diphosphatase